MSLHPELLTIIHRCEMLKRWEEPLFPLQKPSQRSSEPGPYEPNATALPRLRAESNYTENQKTKLAARGRWSV